MTNNQKLKIYTFTALALAVGNAYSQDANQNQIPSSEESGLEVIVVTGTRSQLRNAIDEKRELQRIADLVTEDDVGNLPDFNAAEALSRIPGITVANDQAEGRYVTIRGLNSNFNNTTVDGAALSSTDIDGRRIEMDVVPASMAGTIQVIKSLTPDMDANAVGGTINFVSRSPFDYEDGFMSFSGSVGKYQNDDGYNGSGPSGNGDIVWSNIFGAEEQFGLVVSANYYRRQSYLGRIEQGDEVLFHGDVGTELSSRSDRVDPYASDIYIPEEWKALDYYNDRKRYGGSFRFEHRASDDARTWIRGFFNEAADKEARMETKMWNRERNARITYADTSSGTIENTEWSTQLGRFDFQRQTYGVKAYGKYVYNEKYTFEPSVNYSGSSYEQPQVWDRFVQKSADFSFDTNSRITRWAPTSEDAFNGELFDFQKREINVDGLDEDIVSVSADLGWNNQSYDIGWGYKVGFKHRKKDKVYDYERTEYRFGDDLNLNDIEWSRSCPDEMPSCSNDLFITMDGGSIDNLVSEYLTSADTDLRENEDDDNNRDYDATEEVTALYGLVVHTGEKHFFTAGLRYEDTDFSSSGRREDRDLGEFVPASNENKYDNLLASANLKYDINDELVLRTAFSQSISRPRISYQAARGERQDFNGTELTVTRGNPNLQPREANNLDIGLEWYFEEGGLLSAAIFYKNIDNQIYRTTQDAETLYDQDGDGTLELTPTSIREYVNGDDADLYGLELGYTKELDSLVPGLGFNVNATFLGSDFEVELEDGQFREPETFIQQANFTGNAVIYYQNGPFEGRIAANRTGEKLNNLFTSNINDAYRDQYDEARTQVDLQFRYDVSDKIGLYANITNLFDKEQYELFGREQEFTRWESDFGRAIFFGFSIKN
jgi:TonB-dependent receptor